MTKKVEIIKTKPLFVEHYNIEMFTQDFKRNRVPIECWEGVLDDANQHK